MPQTDKRDVAGFLAFFVKWYAAKLDALLAPIVAENDARADRNKAALEMHGPNAPQEDELVLWVVFEAPVLPPAQVEEVRGRWKAKQQTNIYTTRKLQGLAALAELLPYQLKELGWPIECGEVPLQTVKKELGGSGRAEKADMIFAARRAGIDISPGPEGEDEADAFGVWLVGIKYHAPQHFPRWLARINGGRGTLV